MQRSRQAVNVIVSLVGLQDTGVVAHRPGTAGAAVSVRVGGALLYMNDAATVSHFSRTWATVDRTARQLLPREADATRAMPVRGMAEPAVMVEAGASPPAFARLERPVGRPSHLRVTLGRIMFDVRDLAALRSTVAAFRQAEELAATAFLPVPGRTARERAAGAAARAFAAPPTARHRPAPTARPAATVAGPSRSAERALR